MKKLIKPVATVLLIAACYTIGASIRHDDTLFFLLGLFIAAVSALTLLNGNE